MEMSLAPSSAGKVADHGRPSVRDCRLFAIIVDEARQILDESVEGSRLLEGGIALVRSFGRLAAARQGDANRLTVAIDAAVRVGAGSASLGAGAGAVRLDCLRLRPDGAGVRLLVLAQPADARHEARVAEVARRFALTPAEHRLLALLFEGRALPDAAARLGVARTTARTHLQRLFDKTGVRRQATLLRMVAMADGLLN